MASDAASSNHDRPAVDTSAATSGGSASHGGESVASDDGVFSTRWMSERLAWIAWTALADVLIFRAWGMAGPAVFLALVPLLFWFTSQRTRRVGLMVGWTLGCWLVGVRLLWLGSPLAVVVGMLCIPALAIAAAGGFPWVLETIVLGLRSPLDGISQLSRVGWRPQVASKVGQGQPLTPPSSASALGWGWSVGLPLIAAIVFGVIFVFANPDLHTWVSTYMEQFETRVWEFFRGISVWEVVFCCAALLVGVGLLCPLLPLRRFGPREEPERMLAGSSEPAVLYPAFRNMLLTLIVLFAVYLGFEFMTLWRREFPDGFYYAGYAHEGAAWLTVALALATGTISLVFNHAILDDPRVGRLKRLAWVWSAENFLLAIAVYNRLLIYVGYNGLTRMRWIGFFGITLVVVGFVIVLVKVSKGRSFWWLMRSQLAGLALAIALYCVFPVDYLAHRYNAAQVKAGHLHPSVMIAVKPITDEGVFPLLGLVDVGDEKIREGVLAILADRQSQIELFSAETPWHWTQYQASTDVLYSKLAKNQSLWAKYLRNPGLRESAIEDFRKYAMQWY